MRLLLALVARAAAGNWGAGDVPASFDCAMRNAAYQFGTSLVPRLGAFKPLYDARTFPARSLELR